MALEAPRKLRLRRVAPASNNGIQDNSVIQRNLEQLKANIEKKKRAQAAYYENNSSIVHVSPMSRDFNKRPVKQRLGRKIPFNGTNTSAIPPKRRLLRVQKTGTINNSINSRKSRNTRFSAQQRLNMIRARQQNTDIKVSEQPRRLRLKRTLVNSFSNSFVNKTPKNFMVEVQNNQMYRDKTQFYQKNPHRFRQILNHNVQLEIKRIQLEFKDNEPNILPTKVTPVSTRIPTSVRFGSLH